MSAFTINTVGRSILASSRRCTGRVGACRLRGEAGAFGLGRQRVLLQHAWSSWSSAPSLGLRGDLAGSLGGGGVELRRSPVLSRSASSRGNGEKGSANGIEEEDPGVSREDEEDVIVIGDSAWNEIFDSHASEYDKWVGVHTDEGRGARAKIVDGVMEMVENCTIFSKKRDGTRVELDRAEIRNKVRNSLRQRSSARKEYDKEYRLDNRHARLAQAKQYYQENREQILAKKKEYYHEKRD